MSYLLAKYTLIFLFTALLSFILGYWWSRRNFVDVSESFEALTRAGKPDTPLWDRLWSRLDAIPEPKEADLSGVYGRIDGVEAAISGIPRPKPVSFAAVESRLDAVEKSIKGIPAPERVSFASVESRLDAVEKSIKGIPAPERVSFASVESRLDAVEKSIKGIPAPERVSFASVDSRLDTLNTSIKRIPAPARVDLDPVERRLGAVEQSIRSIPKPAAVDLNPLDRRLSNLEQLLRSIPQPREVDLKPVDRRLSAIEIELRSLRQRMAKPATVAPKPARREETREEPQLLSAALYGNKDDLKRISGVGLKLEGLLNRNGVYYFWQVAGWTERDIDFVDDRLDVFKGRISRDDWVSQARKLRGEPGSADQPAR